MTDDVRLSMVLETPCRPLSLRDRLFHGSLNLNFEKAQKNPYKKAVNSMVQQTILAQPKATGRVAFTTNTIGITSDGLVIEDANAPKVTQQTYLDRVRAYIPVEVLAFFIFINSSVGTSEEVKSNTADNASNSGGSSDKNEWIWSTLTVDDWVAVASVFISIIAIVILAQMAAQKAGQTAWKLHASVSTGAFFVWTYAMHAEVYYALNIPIEASIAGLLLGTFSLFSGLLVPVNKKAA